MDPLDEIQPGWQVVSSEGENVGQVVDISERVVHVKQAGFFGREVDIPETVVESAEDRTVRLTVSKRQLQGGTG